MNIGKRICLTEQNEALFFIDINQEKKYITGFLKKKYVFARNDNRIYFYLFPDY